MDTEGRREMEEKMELELEQSELEGRNAVREAFRAGRTVERLYVQEGLRDGPVQDLILRAKKAGALVDYVPKERLDQMSATGHHQGVIAHAAAVAYAQVEDILNRARERGESPFIFVLDGMEDPHNLGAIIRTANLCGAHGVIIPKRRSASLTAAAFRASAGAANHTPVARVNNLAQTIDELKKEGLWFVCADMDGDVMYDLNLTGPIGLVIGSEGNGAGRLVKERCDMTASIPMRGDIDSLNASVAAGVLAYAGFRRRKQPLGPAPLQSTESPQAAPAGRT